MVEDMVLVVVLYCFYFILLDIDINIVGIGCDVIESIGCCEFDLILLDLCLLDMMGMDVFYVVKEKLLDVFIVFMIVYGLIDMVVEVMCYGV